MAEQTYLMSGVSPEQNKTSMAMTIFYVIVIFVVLYVVYVLLVKPMLETKPIQGGAGGTTTPDNPTTDTPAEPDEKVEVASTPPVPMFAKVQKIEVIRDSTNGVKLMTENHDWKTLNLDEVQAIDINGMVLDSNAYSSASFNPETATGDYTNSLPARNAIDGTLGTIAHSNGLHNIHKLTLVLKEPTNLKSVIVIARGGFLQRLAGSRLNLIDNNGNIVHTQILTSIVTNIANAS